jgi:hypothetical protein
MIVLTLFHLLQTLTSHVDLPFVASKPAIILVAGNYGDDPTMEGHEGDPERTQGSGTR